MSFHLRREGEGAGAEGSIGAAGEEIYRLFPVNKPFTCFVSLHPRIISFHLRQVKKLLLEGAEEQLSKKPTLIALNKKDMLKPGEIASKVKVRAFPLDSTKAI